MWVGRLLDNWSKEQRLVYVLEDECPAGGRCIGATGGRRIGATSCPCPCRSHCSRSHKEKSAIQTDCSTQAIRNQSWLGPLLPPHNETGHARLPSRHAPRGCALQPCRLGRCPGLVGPWCASSCIARMQAGASQAGRRAPGSGHLPTCPSCAAPAAQLLEHGSREKQSGRRGSVAPPRANACTTQTSP